MTVYFKISQIDIDRLVVARAKAKVVGVVFARSNQQINNLKKMTSVIYLYP